MLKTVHTAAGCYSQGAPTTVRCTGMAPVIWERMAPRHADQRCIWVLLSFAWVTLETRSSPRGVMPPYQRVDEKDGLSPHERTPAASLCCTGLQFGSMSLTSISHLSCSPPPGEGYQPSVAWYIKFLQRHQPASPKGPKQLSSLGAIASVVRCKVYWCNNDLLLYASGRKLVRCSRPHWQ